MLVRVDGLLVSDLALKPYRLLLKIHGDSYLATPEERNQLQTVSVFSAVQILVLTTTAPRSKAQEALKESK